MRFLQRSVAIFCVVLGGLSSAAPARAASMCACKPGKCAVDAYSAECADCKKVCLKLQKDQTDSLCSQIPQPAATDPVSRRNDRKLAQAKCAKDQKSLRAQLRIIESWQHNASCCGGDSQCRKLALASAEQDTPFSCQK